MLKWVTIKKFPEAPCYTEVAVRKKIQDRKWPDAVWIKAPDGHILINTEEYERWVESAREAKPAARRSGLASPRPAAAGAKSPQRGDL
jgi:hypothetical protein